MTPTPTEHAQQRHFSFAIPYGGATSDPIPLLMTDRSAPCGVIRPLWIYPDSDAYFLFHVDDDAFEQIVQFVKTETRIDEYARKLAPFYDSIQSFLRDATVRIERAAVIEELYKHPELLPAIASIFTARETIRLTRTSSAPVRSR